MSTAKMSSDRIYLPYVCGSRPRQALAGLSDMDPGRLRANLELTWVNLKLTSRHFEKKSRFMPYMEKALPTIGKKQSFANHPIALRGHD